MEEEVESTHVDKCNKPKDSKFHQQKLWAWQPILTTGNVCPYFYVVGLLFIPLGAFFLVTSNQVEEVSIPYTHCKTVANLSCADQVRQEGFYSNYSTCPCELEFTVENDILGPVHLFYGLTNFFQNHRRYVLSRDDDQLSGKDIAEPNINCDPYRTQDVNGVKKIVAPCGAIARSLFNDTFEVTLITKKGSTTPINQAIDISFDNIAWKSDMNGKFGIPPPDSWAKTVKPSNWPRSAVEFNPKAYQEFQQLIVWMRVSALPNFRKNYGDLKQDGYFASGLPAGVYKLSINYSYPVTQFGGTKRFIISSSSWLGGKNPTLGIAYIVVGCIHIILAVIFTGIDLHLRRREIAIHQLNASIVSIQSVEDRKMSSQYEVSNMLEPYRTKLPRSDLLLAKNNFRFIIQNHHR